MSSKIIIDTDPGQDDAIAILLALASRGIEVLGITPWQEMSPFPSRKNARIIMELAGKPQVQVFAGCDAPSAPLDYGGACPWQADDGPVLPDPQILQAQHGVDFIIETIRNAPPKTSRLPIRTVDEYASALLKAPDIIERIEEIILMGGAYFEVGVLPSAEFNIYVGKRALILFLNPEYH